MKRSKKYLKRLEKLDKERLYSPSEAFKLLKEESTANFDETIEVHLRLGVNPKDSSQQVRGTVNLPHGTGKKVKVAVFSQGEKIKEAEEAGADFVGAQDLVDKVAKGFTDFDVAIATPDMMSSLAKLGKVLGPKGLMPNPKSGTVTFEVGKTVKALKKGKIEYKVDKFGIVHLILGKVSFEEKTLLENYFVLLEEIMRAKPSGAKGKYVRSITLTSTMGPGIKIDSTKTKETLEEAA